MPSLTIFRDRAALRHGGLGILQKSVPGWRDGADLDLLALVEMTHADHKPILRSAFDQTIDAVANLETAARLTVLKAELVPT